MARNFAAATTGNISYSSSTSTILRITAPSTSGVVISRIDFTANGTSGTDNKCVVELIRGTTGGTGTSLTVQKVHGHTGSITATAEENVTGESGGVVLGRWNVAPSGGLITPEEIILNPNERLSVRVIASSAFSATARVRWEE